MVNNIKEVSENNITPKGKFFSPTQIVFGTVIGGLAAGMYFCAKNYESMGDYKKRNITYAIGFISILIIMSIMTYVDFKMTQFLVMGLGFGLYQYTIIYLNDNNIKIKGKFFKTIENNDMKQSAGSVIVGIIISIIIAIIIGLIITFIFKSLGIQIK
jgi:hypothetical protein